jgi:hypothetical protein
VRLLRDAVSTVDRLTGESSRVIRDYVAGTLSADGRQSAAAPRFIPITEMSAQDY